VDHVTKRIGDTAGMRRAIAAAMGIAMLGALVLAGAAGSAPDKKRYTLTPASQTGTPLSGTLSWTIANTSQSPQTIGSAEIRLTSAFDGFQLTGVSPNATLNGAVVELRDLAVPPGSSITITASYTAPCSGGTAWFDGETKQSNDFLGKNNNFLNGRDVLTTVDAVIAPCAYKLVFASQPADTVQDTATKSQAVTTAIGDPTADPVEVHAVDAVTGTTLVPIDTSVTVSALAVSGDGAFSGSFAMTDGVATLDDLVITSNSPKTPLGLYVLRASTVDAVGSAAESDEFAVIPELCLHDGTSTDTCTGELTVQGKGGGSLTYLAEAFDLDNSMTNVGGTSLAMIELSSTAPAGCGTGFTPLGPGVEIITRPLAGSLTVTIEISKLDRQYLQNNGLAKLAVCIVTNLPFTRADWSLSPFDAVEGGYVGVVPDCPATTDLTEFGGKANDQSPCLKSRESVKGGAKLVVTLPNVGVIGSDGELGYDPRAYTAP
jgi:hypothetical protein